MEMPLLGREYAYPLLSLLARRDGCTFTALLTQLGSSRGTLATTLKTLVKEGLVRKERVGKYSLYRLSEKGANLAASRSPVKIGAERISSIVLEMVKEQGLLDKYPDISLEDAEQFIAEKVKDFLEDAVRSLEHKGSTREEVGR